MRGLDFAQLYSELALSLFREVATLSSMTRFGAVSLYRLQVYISARREEAYFARASFRRLIEDANCGEFITPI